MLSDRPPTDESNSLPEQPPAMKWAVRIFITIFTLPFFAVGLSMIGGGGLLGFRGGPAGTFGWFGVFFGLAFIAVPSLMLCAIWMPWGKRASAQMREQAPEPMETAQLHDNNHFAAMQMCRYCGRPRPTTEPTCPACGAH